MKTKFLAPYASALIGSLLVAGCGSEENVSQAPISVYVPFSINALPIPNDGYGFDSDHTIAFPVENQVEGVDRENFYRSSDTVYAALDGWGLCVEPIRIPIASIDADERYPLDSASLVNNIMLIDAASAKAVPAEITASGEEIKIACQQALNSESRYFLAVSDRVKTQFGEPLMADASFTSLLSRDEDDLSETELLIKQQITLATEAYQQASGQGNVIYGAQFTTQSVYPILDSIIEHDASASLGELTKINDARKYDTYQTSLTMPYYLPFTKEDEASCLVDEFDPITACPDLYRWMKPESGGEHLTKTNTLPQSTSLDVVADIHSPTDWDGKQPLPVVLFIHGVTADKNAASLMVKDYVDQGFLVAAIDMPYHGERIMYDREGNEISAQVDKANFINIASPLTLRGNLTQAVSDNLSLRYALNKVSWTDPTNVHLVGHSLGGIVSVMVSEMSQQVEALHFNTVNFVVPGQGLVNLTLTSDTLGEETEQAIKQSPDIQRGIAETLVPQSCQPSDSNETCILSLREFESVSEHNQITVSALEEDIYALLLPDFKQGIQASTDSADPANFVQRQNMAMQPTLLIEAVGNCNASCEVGEYLPDFVVPNSSPDNVMTGTDPLVTALNLGVIRGSVIDESGTGLRVMIRATVGGHGTYLFPYEGPMDEEGKPGIPDTEILDEVWNATDTQQVAVASMVISDGGEVMINNLDNIE
ncbi:Bacterial virulence factor lipase N-terminal/Alpha/beta hydrolase family [Shewanella psychrophila]|uniref:Bacterial virulence factor lipase N-terminal/Alpha/beta hydrolase family n=1 Tax=Shewanella psychrophila TaxID=225848 RepID=A0A1S6HNP0_9GAMM|nr:hypothetical protein [Shewanella psychrophila]AQS37151.1 Bacterial virulence factor lipase N-terminal/Alpha/beta hydrolase family [Shewanella psychrophila]